MATAESVKNKLQGLIDTANETTGGSDTDLTTAIATLVAGFGKGSDDEGGVKVWMSYKTAPATAIGTRVAIDFGFVPDFLLYISTATITPTSGRAYPIAVCGFSSAAKAALGTVRATYAKTSGTTIAGASMYSWCIDDGPSSNALIREADETGFTIGNTPLAATSLIVLAIGGLA